MFLLLYPFLALVSLLLVALTCILAPLLVLSANSEANLPKFLCWFQTFDNTLDAGWKVQGNYGTYLKDGTVPAGFTLYWYRVRWLWRNPGYGFDYWPLGVAFNSADWAVLVDDGVWWIAFGPNGRFCVRYLATTKVGLKLGWKAWAYWNDTTPLQKGSWKDASYSWGPDHRAPICFTP